MKKILFLLAFPFCLFAFDDVTAPNTFAQGDTIKASDFNENFDTLTSRINDNADTVNIKFMRKSAYESGDSSFTRLDVDTINLGYLRGNPAVDTITLDYLRGNPSVDSAVVGIADINGGTIDGTIIGGSSAAAGTFTTITGTKANITDSVTIISTDTGATAAPSLFIYRNSANPAANGALGEIVFRGENSVGGLKNYARIGAYIVDPTSTSEGGYLTFSTIRGGTLTEAARIDNQNRLILNTTDPNSVMPPHSIGISSNSTTRIVVASYSNTASDHCQILCPAARGTEATPLALESDDDILTIAPRGYDGTSYNTCGTIEFSTDGTVSTGVVPTRLDFYMTDTSGSLNNVATFKNTGNFGVNTTAPDEKIHVIGNIKTQKSDNGATPGPEYIAYRNSSSPADNDTLGELSFYGKSSNGTNYKYGRIYGLIEDVSDTSGGININVSASGGTEFTCAKFSESADGGTILYDPDNAIPGVVVGGGNLTINNGNQLIVESDGDMEIKGDLTVDSLFSLGTPSTQTISSNTVVTPGSNLFNMRQITATNTTDTVRIAGGSVFSGTQVVICNTSATVSFPIKYQINGSDSTTVTVNTGRHRVFYKTTTGWTTSL